MRTFLERYDFLLLPAVQVPPFPVDQPYVTEINGVKLANYMEWMKSCYLISATSHPAISVPAGFTDEGCRWACRSSGATATISACCSSRMPSRARPEPGGAGRQPAAKIRAFRHRNRHARPQQTRPVPGHRERLRGAGRSHRARPRRARTSSASASASRISRRRCTCRRPASAPSARASTATRRRPASTRCARRRRNTWPACAADCRSAPEDVVVGAGAKPFIAYAILSTTDHGAGDEVIYPNPGFPIYESQIVACGAKPVPVQLQEARDFAFDPAELEKLITPKTKLLILNYPHNPTGGLLIKKGSGSRSRQSCKSIPRSGSTPTRSIRACATRASSSRSRSCPACTSAPSFPTAPRRPGR